MTAQYSFVQSRLPPQSIRLNGLKRQSDQIRPEQQQSLSADLLTYSTEDSSATISVDSSLSWAGDSLRGAEATQASVVASAPLTMVKTSRDTTRNPIVPSPSTDSNGASMYEPYTVTAQGFPVNNKLSKGQYVTSIDDRGYLSVYEFQLNDQTIMWDYCTGLVHLTGIWKALGNSKADIVRLVDSHPELEGVIRRIRGGFLKIQGTWVPYALCKQLALRTCYTIRHALISLFGPEFPDQCLRPDVRGYGTLTLDDSGIDNKRRKKRKIETAVVHKLPVQPTRKHSEREPRPRVQRYEATAASPIAVPKVRKQQPEYFSPPPIPSIVDVSPSSTGFYPSKTELLDLLRASRCLQMISAGSKSQAWDAEGSGALGGHFDLSGTGTIFHWDGKMSGPKGLNIVDDHSSDQEHSQSDATPLHDSSSLSSTNSAPMLRKFSSATSGSSEYGAVTPPHQAMAIDVGIRRDSQGSCERAPWYSGHTYNCQDNNMGAMARKPIRTAGIDILSPW